VTAENLFVDDGDDWQTIETVRERLPQLDAVPPLAYSQPHDKLSTCIVAYTGKLFQVILDYIRYDTVDKRALKS